MLGYGNYARLLLDFLLDHLAKHAFTIIIEVTQSVLKSLAHLERNHGRCDNLRVRMCQTGARVNAMILENRDVRDSGIEAKLVVPGFVDSQNFSHVGVGHQGKYLGVIGGLNDHVMNPKTTNHSPGTVN